MHYQYVDGPIVIAEKVGKKKDNEIKIASFWKLNVFEKAD
jgi:hypothetical protein